MLYEPRRPLDQCPGQRLNENKLGNDVREVIGFSTARYGAYELFGRWIDDTVAPIRFR
jgi:hypothetical protein